jgi:hypothetical protein
MSRKFAAGFGAKRSSELEIKTDLALFKMSFYRIAKFPFKVHSTLEMPSK